MDEVTKNVRALATTRSGAAFRSGMAMAAAEAVSFVCRRYGTPGRHALIRISIPAQMRLHVMDVTRAKIVRAHDPNRESASSYQDMAFSHAAPTFPFPSTSC